MSILSTYSISPALPDDAEMFSKTHLVGTFAAAVGGLAWFILCIVLDWKFVGVAGVAMGFVIGSAAWSTMRFKGDAIVGLIAALLTAFALCLGTSIQRASEIQTSVKAIETEESYIAAIAENLLWQAAAIPVEPSSDNDSFTGNTATPGIGLTEVPQDIRQAAETKWREMSHEEKQKFRDARNRWQATSQGLELEHMNASGGWLSFLSITGIATSLSAALVAWPAIASRYWGWELE